MRFELATRGHDADVRRLLRDNPMPGLISLTFEREPDFFFGAAIEGDVHQTLVGCTSSGRVVGLASRSIRDAFLDGRVSRLGYLSQVRIDPAYRGRSLLAGGWAKIRELHDSDPAEAYITTIIADNAVARRVLEKDRPTKPSYRPWGELHTLALVPRRRSLRSWLPWPREIRRGSPEMLPDIVDCLRRNYERYQFAPHWTAEVIADPSRCRGLSAENFWVALDGGRVTGCVAVWDQQGFKQSVVRGYGRALRYSRPLVNALSRVASLPRLPAVGQPIPHAYLSHVAVDGDDGRVLVSLVDRALHAAREQKLAYLALGLMDANPLLKPMQKAFRHIDYRAILYVVFWPDGQPRVARLEKRIPHVELATL
jgi:hypothetical protein